MRFLDLFLTWAALTDSDPMDNCELACWRENWNKVVTSGRQYGLELQIGCKGEKLTLQTWAHRVFAELRLVAEVMDSALGTQAYSAVCQSLETWIEHPERTLSAQLLDLIQQQGGLGSTGCALGSAYRESNLAHEYRHFTQQQMEQEVLESRRKQQEAEQADEQDFDAFLDAYFAYLK